MDTPQIKWKLEKVCAHPNSNPDQNKLLLFGCFRCAFVWSVFLLFFVPARFNFALISFDRSTDSQLKLWNISKPHCLRTFKGHINEKNFVGLASNGDYVACGKSTSQFKKLRWLLQRRRHFKIELCTLVALCEVSFRLVGTNDFHVRAENERLTDGGSRCREKLK